jgi:hypothetical protein
MIASLYNRVYEFAVDNSLGSGKKSPAMWGILYPEQNLRNTTGKNSADTSEIPRDGILWRFLKPVISAIFNPGSPLILEIVDSDGFGL